MKSGKKVNKDKGRHMFQYHKNAKNFVVGGGGGDGIFIFIIRN